jgi:hypothetical protein
MAKISLGFIETRSSDSHFGYRCYGGCLERAAEHRDRPNRWVQSTSTAYLVNGFGLAEGVVPGVAMGLALGVAVGIAVGAGDGVA